MSVFTAVGVTTATGSETQSKIAVGTAGQIFTSNGTSSLPEFKGNLSVTNGTTYFDGTTLATTAVGTANQVLTSNGASAPTYQAGPAYRLIQTQTFSSKVTVDFLSLSSYATIKVVISSLKTDTASRYPIMLFSTDGGSSFLTTNYLSGSNSFLNDITTTAFTNANSTVSARLTTANLSTASGNRYQADINIYQFNNTNRTSWEGTATTSGGNVSVFYLWGCHTGTTAFDALRFALDDVTSTFSGSISLYALVT